MTLLSGLPLVSISLAVNELVLNSIRHAFEGIENPEIRLSINASVEGVKIDYSDNGVGLSPSDNTDRPEGFGQLLIAGLEQQMKAKISHEPTQRGFALTIQIPL